MAITRDGDLIDVRSRICAVYIQLSFYRTLKPSQVFPKISDALDRPYHYVVLATKAIPELQTTPSLLSPLLSPPYSDAHPQPTYVLLQNGLNVEIALYNALIRLQPQKEPRIISTAVWIGTGLVDKNTVEHNEFVRMIFSPLYFRR